MKPYQRGDVVVIDVPMLANSHIQAGKRPWVVVQNNVGNQFSSTSIVVPLTTKIKRLELPTHVAVTWGSLQPSMVECEQVRVVDVSVINELPRRYSPLSLPETALCMVGRRLSGLRRCGAGESDEEKEVNSCFTISTEPFSMSQTL